METIKDMTFGGERPLFAAHDVCLDIMSSKQRTFTTKSHIFYCFHCYCYYVIIIYRAKENMQLCKDTK